MSRGASRPIGSSILCILIVGKWTQSRYLFVALMIALSFTEVKPLWAQGAPQGVAPCLEGSLADMSCVPGGRFTRGSETPSKCEQGELAGIPANSPNYSPVMSIDVSTFYMDKTEVTFAAYQACVRLKKCIPRRPAYGDFSRPRQPMVGLTWYEAHRFCRAQGKRLPTEAEWERAARGPESTSTPWGNGPVTCSEAVIKNKKGRSCGTRKQGKKSYKGRTLVVASRPAGHYGLFDMIGNAEEWTADWYTRSWKKCGEACTGKDPKGPCGGQTPEAKCRNYRRKVVRGGSWYWGSNCATSWNRRPHFPSNKPYHHFGFRCAASLEQATALMGSPDAKTETR